MSLRPVSKEIIWGGDRLKREYGKKAPFDKLAESWELAVREKEMCTVAYGRYAGMKLGDVIALDRAAVLGTKALRYDRFPLLIKFIDAQDRLSIQVHPDNEYSLRNEGELGKTEMWYIVAADEGAQLVYGLRDGVTVDDFAEAVHSGRTEEALNYVNVHAGEVYFIPSGQVHAIGAGILIAEIQQNSDITYRVYDYNRPGADGKPRQLHTEKAIDVVRLRNEDEISALRYSNGKPEDDSLLASCEYFEVKRLKSDTDNIVVGDDSFLSVLVLESDGAVITSNGETYEIKKGESIFVPAGCGEITVTGKHDIITTTLN